MGASSTTSNVSEVSIVSYSLQKLLIFFMILDAAWMVLGYSFLGPLLSFLFHFLVLQGVKRGRTSILLIYVVLNVIVLSFAAIGTLFAIGAVMTAAPMDYVSSSSSAEQMPVNKPSYSTLISEYLTTTAAPYVTPSSSSSSASASDSYSSSFESSAEIEADNMLLAGSIFLVVSVIVLYCKIYSVVLAARLRRLLLASPVLPVHVTLPVDGVQEQSDSDDKPLLAEQPMMASYDDVNPMFTQPGFVPMQPQLYYPNMQGAPSMMPPPFMYGQHPVFYTFAPAPPTNEKQ